MLRIVFFALALAGLYFGYRAYQAKSPSTISTLPPISISHSPDLDKITDVLGASINNVVDSGRSILNSATDGKSDPIINQALINIQNEVKDLPQEAVDKVKYEFCKDVVTEYENR